MLASSFFRRLFLPYLLLLCGATAAIGYFGAARLRSSYLERTHTMLHDECQLAALTLKPELQSPRPSDLQTRVKQLGEALSCRVTLVDSTGKVLADNEADPAHMDNHRNRPEIAEAAISGEGSQIRPSDTLRQDMFYLCRKIALDDGQIYFVRLSKHLAELDRKIADLYLGLVAVTVVATLASAALCYYFARRHTAPLAELTEFAKALAHGEMDRRLLRPPSGEIATLASALNFMADALGELVLQTSKDNAELLTILASMSEGVIATDLNQRILLINDAAAKLLNFGADGAEGRLLWEVVRHTPVLKAAEDVVSGKTPSMVFSVGPLEGRHLEVTIRRFSSRQGLPRGMSPPAPALAASAMRLGNGAVEGLILVAHDITQAIQYQDMRKEFVANVSHELRTPLSIIKGFAETLREGAIADSAKSKEFLAIIERHVDQLTNLVNDLLELSKLENQPTLARRMPVDLGAASRKVVELLLPSAQRKNQNLTIDVAQNLPLVAGDPDYLERAIGNLIDNAIKYTPETGRISVSVRASNGQVLVEVVDNGIGIPANDLPRIFERFYRVDRSRSREMGGTGLGLSIVKHVAQTHAGKIDVVSTPGVGSTFCMRIPAPAGLSRALS